MNNHNYCEQRCVFNALDDLEFKENILLENEKYCWQECWDTDMCQECKRLGNGCIDYFASMGE